MRIRRLCVERMTNNMRAVRNPLPFIFRASKPNPPGRGLAPYDAGNTRQVRIPMMSERSQRSHGIPLQPIQGSTLRCNAHERMQT